MNTFKKVAPTIKRYIQKHPYIAYTVLFILILVIGLLPIEIKNNSFLFSGLFANKQGHFDALKQHLLFMEDFVSVIKGFLLRGEPIVLYRTDLGLGGDFVLNYTYYSLFDPITLIAYILPLKSIELSYYIILLMRIYLSGLFMMILVKKMLQVKPMTHVLSGLIYALSSITLYSAFRHPMFTNGVMYLPLLILGAEIIFEKRYPFLFIIVTFLAVISQFYVFVFTLFGFAIYLIFRTLELNHKKYYIIFLQIVGYGFLAIMMGAFVLLPQVYALMEGSRTSSKGFLLFDGLDVAAILISHLVPVMGNKYSLGIGNIMLLVGILIYLFSKKIPNTWIKYSLIVFFILNFVSFFAFAISGFSYVNNRWTMVMLVPATLAFSAWIDGQVEYSEIEVAKVIKLIFFLLVSILMLTGFQLTLNASVSLPLKLVLISIITLIYLFLCYTMWRMTWPKKVSISKFNHSKYAKWTLLSIVITIFYIAIFYTNSLTPNHALENYYPDRNRYDDYFDQDSFYRVEQKVFSGSVDSFSNDNLIYGYRGTYQYNTMASGYINELMTHLEVTNHNNTVGYNGFSYRTQLMSLNHVKYVIIRESEKTIPPFGFQLKGYVMVEKYDDHKLIQSPGGNILVEEGQIIKEKAFIYENQYDVQFGYMVYETMSDQLFIDLDPLDQESVLLSHVVLPIDQNQNDFVIDNKVTYHQITIEKIDETTLKMVIPLIEQEELYIKLEGFSFYDPIYTHTETIYQTKSSLISEINYKKGTHMYVENEIHLVNLGYYDREENLEVFIKFKDQNVTYEKIQYALVKMDGLSEKVDKLNQSTLENVRFNTHGFTGNITNSRKGYLVVNLPYTEGFKAYVDGSEVSINRANIGYMAIEVEAGNHQISFLYHTKGLKEGAWISVASLVLIGLFYTSGWIVHKKIKKIDTR